jgi:hypothetical protein
VTPAAALPAESGEQFALKDNYVVTTSAFEDVRSRMPREIEFKREKPSLFKHRDEERPAVK